MGYRATVLLLAILPLRVVSCAKWRGPWGDRWRDRSFSPPCVRGETPDSSPGQWAAAAGGPLWAPGPSLPAGHCWGAAQCPPNPASAPGVIQLSATGPQVTATAALCSTTPFSSLPLPVLLCILSFP